MIIIWGQRNCGKVDHVPNLFYVSTQFFHLYYIPLIPLQSFLVIAGTESGDGFQGVHIPMNFKSVLFGWLRTALILAMIVCPIVVAVNGIEALDENHPGALETFLIALTILAGSILLYILTLRFGRAGFQRAQELGESVGIPKHVIAQFYIVEPGSGGGPDRMPDLPEGAEERWYK